MRWVNVTCATVFLFVIVLACMPALHSQTATGEVNGTVTDSQGAVVPDATVKLVNQATKIETSRPTNGSGYFTFINVQPGSYVVQVEKTGFKKVTISAFDVGVNQTVTQSIKLDVGAVDQTVEVSASSTLIEPTTTELGTVIGTRAVNELPLNGRNFTQLLTLTPGVTPVSTAQNRSIGGIEGNFGIPGSAFSDASFQGQNNRSKLYFFDGIINTNVRGPTYIVLPNIDLVQEFKIVSHDPKAEFGGVSGGVTNIVSKSGGNSFHGAAFEYLRNDYFDARNSITDVCNAARCKPGQIVPGGPAPFRQNQFGGIFTGPIIKNRTFFSVGYDGWRYSKPSQALSYVPTAAQLNGDFSQPAAGVSHNIYNPFVAGRPQFTGNVIPPGMINKSVQTFLQTYLPTPNLTGNANFNFVQNRPSTNTSDAFQLRIDHRFGDKDNIFLRYNQQTVNTMDPVGQLSFTKGYSTGYNYGAGWIHSFKPNLIMDIRAGFAGRPGHEAELESSLGNSAMVTAGFADITKYGGLLMSLTTPWNGPGANSTNGNQAIGSRGPGPRKNPNWSVTPNISWLVGNHNIKAGFWYIQAGRTQLNTFQQFFFADTQSGNGTANTGFSLASALLGLPNQFQGQLPTLSGGEVRFTYSMWSPYIQDEWKLRSNLTVSAGLRLDALTQPYTNDNRMWNALDLFRQQWILGASALPPLCSAAGQAPCIPDGAPFYTPTSNVGCNNTTIPCDFRQDPHFGNVVLAGKRFFAPPPVRNWGPRVGIAWQLFPNTVIHAGYGLYYDAITTRSQYAQNDLEMAVWPFATAFNGTVNPSGTTPASLVTINQINGHFPTPLPQVNPWNPVNTFADDPRLKVGYSHQWNFEIQHQVTSTTMFSVAYVGSSNHQLPYTGLANAARRASPNGTSNALIDSLKPMPWVSSNLRYTLSVGNANYNALETKVQRRFSNGLATLLSYTWGKSIDNSSGFFNVENGDGGSSAVQNFFDIRSSRAVSGYDITHFVSWATGYELPFGHGKRWAQSGPLSWIIGNWQTNTILQARTGQPYTIQVGGDIANIGGSTGGFPPSAYGRPNLIADPFTAGPVMASPDPLCHLTTAQVDPTDPTGQRHGKAPLSVRNRVNWFNPCAFAVPIGGFGTLGRNTFRSPAMSNVDFSLLKIFPLPREGWQLRFEAQIFNLFNTQIWGNPNALTIGNGTSSTSPTAFGSITASAGQVTSLTQGTQPREMQFGLRFQF